MVDRKFKAELARRVKAAMEQHPTLNTQLALSEACGVAQSTISKLLKGSDASVGTLFPIARALGVTLDSLMPDVPEVEASAAVSKRTQRTFSQLQRAFLETATRLVSEGRLSDAQCIEAMHAWKEHLQPKAA